MAATPGAGTSISPVQRELESVMKASVNRREPQSRCTIFRVEKREREKRKQFFQHDLISLGLYDRLACGSSDPKSDGDKFRLEIVGRLLEELGKPVEEWVKICEEIVQDPKKIRELYDEVDRGLEVEDVRNVLTLDALFLACCLGTYFHPIVGSMFFPVYEILQRKGASFCNLLFIDILKLENQVPLFLIQRALEFMISHHDGRQAGRVSRHETTVDVNPGVGKEVQPRNEIRQGNDIPQQLNTERNEAEEESGDEIRQGSDIPQQLNTERKNQAEEKRGHERQPGNKITGVNVSRVLELICKNFAFHHSSSLPFKWLGRRERGRAEFRFQDSAHLLASLYDGIRAELLSHFGEHQWVWPDWVNRWRKFPPPIIAFSPNWFKWRIIALVKRRWSLCTRSMFGSRRHDWDTNMASRRDLDFIQAKIIDLNARGFMPSATKLHEAGINCRGRSSPTTPADNIVEFKRSLFNATLFLPTITNVISDSEGLWRNLVAYEYGQGRYGPDVLMAYFHFMDMLINTEKDVVLLTMGKFPVINRHSLGNEKATANLYNSILANYNYGFPTPNSVSTKLHGLQIDSGFQEPLDLPGVFSCWELCNWDLAISNEIFFPKTSYKMYIKKWNEVTSAIHVFCNNTTRQKLVEFSRAYLSKPWLIVSILGAINLLALTALQTHYSKLSYIHRGDN